MNEIKALVSKELNQIEEQLSDLNLPNNEVFLEIQNFTKGKSKRIRSLLTLLYIRANNKEIKPEIIKVLSAAEIIHNASLLHDDVIDNASTRRGQSTVAQLFSPKISIISGDYLLTKGIDLLLTVDDNIIFKSFNKTIQKMCNAEIKQFLLRGIVPSEEEYLDICRGKTASLFATLLESCATFCGLPSTPAKVLGEEFGLLFQIRNDLEKFSAQADKENGIFTVKDIYGIEKTSILIDNYQEKIREKLSTLPNNIYKNGLFDLLGKI